MTPDPDDDIRDLLRRRAESVTARGTYADLERKLGEAPPAAPRWQRPVVLSVAAVLALLLGAGVVALATDGSDEQHLRVTDGPTSSEPATSTTPPDTAVAPDTTVDTTAPVQTTTEPSATTSEPADTTTSTTSSTTTTVPAAEPVTDASRVGLRGIGSVSLPLSVDELGRVTGQSTRLDPPEPGGTCSYVRLVTGPGSDVATPAGVSFMVLDGTVVRVDVYDTPRVRATSGAGIGTTEAELKQLYPAAVVRTGHYSSPEYPSNDVVVTDPSAPGYELLFETHDGVVTSFRSGVTNAVEAPEGCA